MAFVCALAYAVGSVIRYNIKHAEPVLADKPSEMTLSFERLSDITLVLAYVISVCLYLHILASFVLGSLQRDTEFNENLVTTGVIVVIMLIRVGLFPLFVLTTTPGSSLSNSFTIPFKEARS